MLIRIVSILFPLFAITALGYFVGRRVKPDLSHANKLNMDVFVPALVFGALVSKDFRIGEYLPLLLATLVIIVGSGVVGLLVARSAGIASKTLVPPMMFNNCGNLGLPLAVLAFGDSALAPAVVMFVVSNVIHFSYGAWLLDHHTRL
ncbi:MAG: AEC family transporter, partial [Proteobacteria bacterium]|nr:AEC family transporter [Pseudomonadota bacterium]